MSLNNLGWNEYFQSAWDARTPDAARAFRVTEEHRGRYKLAGESGEIWAELAGRLRHEAAADDPLPGVGDWVAAIQHSEADLAIIVDRLPRRTALLRQAAGRRTSAQLVAANIDLVLVVTSCNEDFNPRRIERYLALVWESGADVAIVLNKVDLCEDPQRYIDELETVAMAVPILAVSAIAEQAGTTLASLLAPGKTIALVGSSGVGKSTLVNVIAGRQAMAVGAVRQGDDRGRHTTTHRQLICLSDETNEPRGVLIDTPGMRELQLWGDGDGLGHSFTDIEALAEHCRFRDCGHSGEPGCAVTAAIEAGDLTVDRLESFRKLEREQRWMENKRDASFKQEQRRRSKMIRQMQATRSRLEGKSPATPKG